MDLSRYDGTAVRLTTKDGEVFEGVCTHESAEYCGHEYGRAEDALDMDGWLFYRTQIGSVERINEADVHVWMDRTLHKMTLDPAPFAMIENGAKKYELRLNDEKRQIVRVGDVIRFARSDDDTEILWATVTERRDFPTFAALYADMPLSECGYTPENLSAASPADMDRYYTPEQQQKYNAVAFGVEPM